MAFLASKWGRRLIPGPWCSPPTQMTGLIWRKPLFRLLAGEGVEEVWYNGTALQLGDIQRRVATQIRYTPDKPGEDRWGVLRRKWVRSILDLDRGRWISLGDCDDYCVAYAEALVAAGCPWGAMRLAIVQLPTRRHMVLLVRLSDEHRGWWVMDNNAVGANQMLPGPVSKMSWPGDWRWRKLKAYSIERMYD